MLMYWIMVAGLGEVDGKEELLVCHEPNLHRSFRSDYHRVYVTDTFRVPSHKSLADVQERGPVIRDNARARISGNLVKRYSICSPDQETPEEIDVVKKEFVPLIQEHWPYADVPKKFQELQVWLQFALSFVIYYMFFRSDWRNLLPSLILQPSLTVMVYRKRNL